MAKQILHRISNFLMSLHRGKDGKLELSPTVRRLIGVGSGAVDLEDYHDHLLVKYGT